MAALLILLVLFQISTAFFNPEETAGLFEGDIELQPSSGFRSALNDRTRLWDHGEVPYIFSEKSYFDEDQKANISAAMEEFHKHTCIRWVPRTNQEKYIKFVNGNGCSSNVGRLRSTFVKITQRIMLGAGCFNKGIIMHEMMHTVGFFHEQSRFDRDKYVNIVDKNIKQGFMAQFRMHQLDQQNQHLAPYDYGSIMHYRKDTFSENGDDTIVPIKEGATIGQRERFSDIDIYKMNKLYKCPGYEREILPHDAYEVPTPNEIESMYPIEQKSQFGCTFDLHWSCGFHDEMSNDLDWKIGKGASSRDGKTGPTSDATYDECCYIHIHTVGHEPGDKARLVSPILKANEESCLSFHYHMKGRSIGTLRVYIRDYEGNRGPTLWEKSGHQSNFWKQAHVKVEHYRPFELVFEATVGDSEHTSYEGDIAIDSVRYSDTASMRFYRGECA